MGESVQGKHFGHISEPLFSYGIVIVSVVSFRNNRDLLCVVMCCYTLMVDVQTMWHDFLCNVEKSCTRKNAPLRTHLSSFSYREHFYERHRRCRQDILDAPRQLVRILWRRGGDSHDFLFNVEKSCTRKNAPLRTRFQTISIHFLFSYREHHLHSITTRMCLMEAWRCCI